MESKCRDGKWDRQWSCCSESGDEGRGEEGVGPELISDAKGKRICTEEKEGRVQKDDFWKRAAF